MSVRTREEKRKMIKHEHVVEFITTEQKEQLIDKLHEWLCEFGYGDSPDDALYMAENGADRFLMYCGIGIKDE